MSGASDLADRVKARRGRARRRRRRGGRAARRSCPTSSTPTPPSAARTTSSSLEHVGTPRDFAAEGFTVRDHVELGELLGAIDIERGAKVSGSRFYYLTGVGALLELALVNHAIALACGNGFTPMIPPALVKPPAMEGTGFLGQAAENVYRLEADDMYLVGTAEVPLAAYHSDEILDAAHAAAPLRRLLALLPPRGGLGRQATPAASSACTGSTRSRCSPTARPRTPSPSTRGCSRWERQMLRQPRDALPRHRRRVRRPRRSRRAQVRHRGVDPVVGATTARSPRRRTAPSSRRAACGPPARRGRRTPARDPQRHPGRDHAHDRGAAGEPPAGRRLRARAGRAAPLPRRPRDPHAARLRAGLVGETGATGRVGGTA